LVLAKCAAGRQRDWDYAREMLRLGLVDYEVLVERIDEMPVAQITRTGLARCWRGSPRRSLGNRSRSRAFADRRAAGTIWAQNPLSETNRPCPNALIRARER
jgi:hypothetical protein